MCGKNDRAEREYSGGKEDWAVAAQIAGNCPGFEPDDEDEMVADEPISCYNCRFRRWTVKSFACLNQSPPDEHFIRVAVTLNS